VHVRGDVIAGFDTLQDFVLVECYDIVIADIQPSTFSPFTVGNLAFASTLSTVPRNGWSFFFSRC
jgi:hypothetical protein